MNVQRILELIDLVAQADIAELTITEGDQEIHLARRATAQEPQVPVGVAVTTPESPPHAAHMGVPVAGAPVAEAAPAPVRTVHHLRSPMVGTFYRSAKTGGEPLVQVGARVEAGTPLCMIEAMKIMNEIEADKPGTVTAVLCEDGQTVEFDQPLFVIE